MENYKSKINKAISTIAIVYTIISVFSIISIFAISIVGGLNILLTFVYLGSVAISLILIWGLHYAIDKVDLLQYELTNKKIIKENFENKYNTQEDVLKCNVCNTILDKNTQVCPICKNPLAKIDKTIKDTSSKNSKLQPTYKGKIIADNIELCKKCGYQLFEEDTICPNCNTKRN